MAAIQIVSCILRHVLVDALLQQVKRGEQIPLITHKVPGTSVNSSLVTAPLHSHSLFS